MTLDQIVIVNGCWKFIICCCCCGDGGGGALGAHGGALGGALGALGGAFGAVGGGTWSTWWSIDCVSSVTLYYN